VTCSTHSSSWRAWVGQQLAAGSSPSTAHNAGRRLLHAAAAARPPAPAAAAGRWWDTWVMWVDRRSAALLMASLLNSLNSVGHKLPVALGLLLVDMAHSSPLLGGSRADAWEPQVLPASLPAGGFYANGGPAAATLAAADAACGGGASSSAASGGGARARAASAWSELGAALSASARLLWLGCIWLPALITAPLLVHGSARWRAWWLALMTLSLEASGPAFIKWGQVRGRGCVGGVTRAHSAVPCFAGCCACHLTCDDCSTAAAAAAAWCLSAVGCHAPRPVCTRRVLSAGEAAHASTCTQLQVRPVCVHKQQQRRESCSVLDSLQARLQRQAVARLLTRPLRIMRCASLQVHLPGAAALLCPAHL
jgi:hypothetical protein